MLVLTRKSDESLTFTLPSGERMLIRIKDIHSQSAKLCIDAPPSVKVMRTEAMRNDRSEP